MTRSLADEISADSDAIRRSYRQVEEPLLKDEVNLWQEMPNGHFVAEE